MSSSFSNILRIKLEHRQKMNKLIFIALLSAFIIVDGQNPVPTVPDELKSVTIPSMAQMPIPPPGSPSSQSISTKNNQTLNKTIQSKLK